MAVYDDKLADIVDKLGRYWSIVSKEDFMALLAFGGDDAVGSFGTVDLDPTPEMHKVIRAFTNSTEGGVTMMQAMQALIDAMSGATAGEVSDMVDLAKRLYRIVGEPEAFDTLLLPTGVGSPTWPSFIGSTYSAKKCMKIDEDGEGKINGAFASPTKYTPNVTALQVFNPKLTPAKRDTGAAALWMNCIPSLELSRCQPYLDVTVISPKSGVAEDGRIQTMGMMQFLLGTSHPVDNTADFYMATALDGSALHDFEQAQQTIDAQADALPPSDPNSVDPDFEEPEIATAGMEMFTAPQTMVPVIGDGPNARMERYEDYEAFSQTPGSAPEDQPEVGGRRGAGIIDPFRPMMTIEDFSVSVTPSKGFMSHETAEISMIMHDRSRLTEISEFVKPDLYGHTELLITYGWSHPDPSGHTDASGNVQGNFFGTFIDLNKVKKKYMVVNSSFSFDEVGQVKIKLKLSMKGSGNIDTANLSQGEGVDNIMQALKDLQDAIKVIKEQIMADAEATGDSQSAKDMFGNSFMSAASDTSKAMTMDQETADAIKSFISENRNSSNPAQEELADTLTDMFGSDGQGGVVAEAKATIADAVAAKIQHLGNMRGSNKDPFARTVRGAAGSTQYVNARYNDGKFVSFGAMLMYMIGKPLASTRRFDEIQFCFYPVNDKASYLSNLTVADIPIRLEDFKKKFEEATKTTVNMPLGRFLNFVSKEFIQNQASYVYGLCDLFETDEEGKTEMKEEFKEDATKLNDEKKKRLEDAYGEGADIAFKMPRIKFEMQAVPCKPGTHPNGKKGTILRIHIYDTVCTPYTALHKMMGAARSDSIGLMSSAAGGVPGEVEAAAGSSDGWDCTHQEEFIEGLVAAIEAGLLECVPQANYDDFESGAIDIEDFVESQFRVKGGFPALKDFMMKSMPSIIYGSSNSAVLSADLSSMNNPKLASVNMLRGGMGGGDGPQGSRDAGLPLQTAPVSLSLTTYGCPLIAYGQQFFVDFGTGTTIDNTFVVTGIDHSLSQGKFETKLKMTQIDAFGKYISMMDSVKTALTAMSDSSS
tara:strand:- start:52559 stop:55690 length:3132 start_codon:yes stop_codon:yes gene_type:complete